MKPIRMAVMLALALLSLSCSPSRESSLNLAPTPPLSGGPGWAVVKEAYARLKDAPSQSGKDLSLLRKGELIEVAGRDLDSATSSSQKTIWYKLKVEGVEGWARESDLDVFSTKAQAERAAKGYR